jgi:4-hydroxyphenylpyruvate dioxygenase-like putative hemolysin
MYLNLINQLTKEEHNMTITYSIWQGSRLLSIDNVATDIKEIDHLIQSLNASELGKATKFNANVMTIKVGE